MPTLNRDPLDPAFDDAAAREAAMAVAAAKAAEEAANAAAAVEAARLAEAAANAEADAERQAAIDVAAQKAAEEAATAADGAGPIDADDGATAEPGADPDPPTGGSGDQGGVPEGAAEFSPPRRWSEAGASHAADAAHAGGTTRHEELAGDAGPTNGAAPEDHRDNGGDERDPGPGAAEDLSGEMAEFGRLMGDEHGGGQGQHSRPEAAGHGDPRDEVGQE